MSNLRRRRRENSSTIEGMLRTGILRSYAPTTNSGHIAYPNGRECLTDASAPGGVASYLAYTGGLPIGQAGTLAIKFTPVAVPVGGSGVFAARIGTSAEAVDLRLAGATGIQPILYVRATDASSQSSSGLNTAQAGVPMYAVCRWGADGKARLNVDGNTRSPSAGGKTAVTPTELAFGRVSTASLIADIRFHGGLLSLSEKSDAWVTAIQADTAVYTQPERLARDYAANGDAILFAQQNAGAFVKVGGASPFRDLMLGFDGNSLLSTALRTAVMSGMASPPEGYWSWAVGGQTTPQMSADAAAQIDPLLLTPHADAVLVAWEWLNDSSTLSARMANMVAYCQARRAAGWKVVALTNASNTNEAAADFAGATTYIRANWATFCDAVADIAADDDIGAAGQFANGTYFSDGTHLTTAGANIAGAIVATAIDSLL